LLELMKCNQVLNFHDVIVIPIRQKNAQMLQLGTTFGNLMNFLLKQREMNGLLSRHGKRTGPISKSTWRALRLRNSGLWWIYGNE
jgi:hypothetical protein